MTMRRTTNGFTLAEMAVVLVIVALLLGGLLAPLTSQTETRQRVDNEKALADIREALIGFAIVNGRLPCPAARGLASDVLNAGMESVTAAGGPCSCAAAGVAGAGAACAEANDVTGVVPWATLGLPETDSWNNRFTYRVGARFGRIAGGQIDFGPGCAPSSAPVNAAFALCTPGDITALTTIGGVTLADNLPAIVVSHGKNGLGAWLPTGAQTPGAVGDEDENADDDTTFVSNTNIDDQMIWVPTNILMNRMIAAGKLP